MTGGSVLVAMDDRGEIEKRGDRYRVRVREEGQRVTIPCGTRATFPSFEDAARALAAWQVAQAERDAPRGLTLRTWGETWFERRATDGIHRGVAKERSVWRMHVLDTALSRMPLRKIERRHVVRWLDDLCRKDAVAVRHVGGVTERTPKGERVSVSTCRKALALVRRALSEAADLGHVAGNVAAGVSVPSRAEDEDAWDWLRAGELAALLSLPVAPRGKRPSGTISLAQRTMVAVAAYTGIRAGVLWRLRWSDVQLDGARPEIHARRTKSGRNRRVPLLPPAVDALRAWRAQQRAIGASLVFPARDGTPHREGYQAGLPRLLRLARVERDIRAAVVPTARRCDGDCNA